MSQQCVDFCDDSSDSACCWLTSIRFIFIPWKVQNPFLTEAGLVELAVVASNNNGCVQFVEPLATIFAEDSRRAFPDLVVWHAS